MKIGLIDVDGHGFPNLALMKIARYYRQQGAVSLYIKTSFLHTKSTTCTKNVFFCVSREKVTKKFCFTRNIFYFCGNIGKGSVETSNQ